ncbi:hypothetical protein [Streptomyces sp. NRRL F-2799]|uniref:hypothetical protein n=1 Tax=Streptomyces sp. NRRL F-2799 TaxID=1463844 RepID=UPI0004CB8F66|nr:hypothetical protein [Streptomyces sp. NRRL F-2799]
MPQPEWPDDLAIVVLLPDALLSGGVRRLGAHLDTLDAHPVRVRSVRLDASHAASFYRGRPRSKSSEKGRIFGGVLTRRLFALDSSLVVLLRRHKDAGDRSSLSQRLHDLKGPSAYLQQQPGSLRALSRSSDRCLSLVHTPDDAEDAASTAALFFNAPPATETAEGLAACTDDAWSVIQDCRSLLPMSFDTSRYAIVACSLLRCTALSLADGTPRPPDGLAQLVRARRTLVEWLADRAGQDPDGERKRFGSLIEQVAWDGGPLETVVTPELAAPVAALLSLPDYDLEWADFIVAEFTRHGLHLNEAEIHTLSTLMTFFDD